MRRRRQQRALCTWPDHHFLPVPQVIAGVFTTIWAVYYVAGRDIDQEDNVCGGGGTGGAH